jgi:hypothetical protein
MFDDPAVIRLNIQHYEELLKLPCDEQQRQRILKLLAEARAELPRAWAAASERKHQHT